MTTDISNERIRVALLEDQQVFRESLVLVLESAGMDVVARCSQTPPFLARVREQLPHVAVLDLKLEPPDQDGTTTGMTALQCLHDFYPSVRSLVLSSHHEPEVVEQCLQAGAAGYLWKHNVGCAEVVEAVTRVARGERLMPPGLSWVPSLPGFMMQHEVPTGGAELGLLTPREREVLGYVAAGADNLKIAACLSITERTVKAHITSIYKKIGSENRTQLAVLALQLGVQRPAGI
ncbi:LuxR C-terminal-related transcriptional regulator [Myxococcus fulvus]|uniref:LuxR C-terminal-related transcriptional regulator n=1 Tax=Myxococcus fulvus TaxID=33 RepID=UPI00237B74CC|nr:response regulator transcription factor [Myxococcus fulvus]